MFGITETWRLMEIRRDLETDGDWYGPHPNCLSDQAPINPETTISPSPFDRLRTGP